MYCIEELVLNASMNFTERDDDLYSPESIAAHLTFKWHLEVYGYQRHQLIYRGLLE